jgi:hypothetical protein
MFEIRNDYFFPALAALHVNFRDRRRVEGQARGYNPKRTQSKRKTSEEHVYRGEKLDDD